MFISAYCYILLMLYDLIDKAALSILPKVGDYRTFAKIVRQGRIEDASKKQELFSAAKRYFEKRANEADFKAYWDVPAQYCLIHVDVFAQDAKSKEAHDAVAEIGKTFQWIKSVDDFVDETKYCRVTNLMSLADLLISKETSKEARIASATGHFVKENYDSLSQETKDQFWKVYKEELLQCTHDDAARYEHRGNTGYLLGQLEFQILKKHLPNFPQRAEKFLALNGKAAAYFDDFKDFQLDRKNGYGYNTNMRPTLLTGCLENTLKGFKLLSIPEKQKHFAFLVLGGLYQLRELIGIQERT